MNGNESNNSCTKQEYNTPKYTKWLINNNDKLTASCRHNRFRDTRRSICRVWLTVVWSDRLSARTIGDLSRPDCGFDRTRARNPHLFFPNSSKEPFFGLLGILRYYFFPGLPWALDDWDAASKHNRGCCQNVEAGCETIAAWLFRMYRYNTYMCTEYCTRIILQWGAVGISWVSGPEQEM